MNLFPPSQLLTQAPIASCFGCLPLERVTLPLHFEHDVIDADQILPRSLQFQLGRASAGFVLRDPGRLFEQLAPIRGSGTEDLADLPLLDHRVGLDPDSRIHHQILNIAQAADLTVDEIFTLAGAVQAAPYLDVSRDDRRRIQIILFCGDGDMREALLVTPMAVPITPCTRHGRRHLCQIQPNFRRRGRLSRIAPAENDVFHAVATQAFRALLAQHPGNGVDDVALATPVRTDNRRDTAVERQLRTFRKALEARDLEVLETHRFLFCTASSPSRAAAATARTAKQPPDEVFGHLAPSSGWDRSGYRLALLSPSPAAHIRRRLRTDAESSRLDRPRTRLSDRMRPLGPAKRWQDHKVR